MSLSFQTSLFDEVGADPDLGPLPGRMQRIDLQHGAWIDIRPGWMSNSDELFERLATRVPWHADTVEMYDRVVAVPRLVSGFGPNSAYPDPVLERAQRELNAFYRAPHEQVFRTAGLCFYRTGDDSVAWHGDRVGAGINRDTMVAIVSVGDPRKLHLRPRTGGADPVVVEMGHGDLVVMGGSCQRTWDHAVPKTSEPMGPRISVQFRPLGVF